MIDGVSNHDKRLHLLFVDFRKESLVYGFIVAEMYLTYDGKIRGIRRQGHERQEKEHCEEYDQASDS